MDWGGKVLNRHIANMAIWLFWPYEDVDEEKKMFKVCGNMDLLQVHVRLQGQWESYSNKWQISIVLMNNLTIANLQIVSNRKHINKWHTWNYIY
jgi:hypothetical protein